jgi:hypothetical protein
MRHFYIRYQANGSGYEGFFFDTFSSGYWRTPSQALSRYLTQVKTLHGLTDGEIDVITFNRI